MRRGLGSGRTLVAIGSIVALIGCFLPWVSAGELSGQVVTANGLSGMGIVVFLSAVGLLLLVLLPYASSSGRSALDRPILFAFLGGTAIAGLVIRIVQLWSDDSLRLWPPDNAFGLWLAIVGVILIALGIGELLGEKPPRSPIRPPR